MRIGDFAAPGRAVLAPPQVEGGPFSELWLAPDPAGAAAGQIGRRRAGSEQPIWGVVRDVLGAATYAVEATGVRVKDRHSDSRLVGGTPGLCKEGEYARSRLPTENRELVGPAVGVVDEEDDRGPMSDEWTTISAFFRETVAGVEIPGDSGLRTIKPDWCLLLSIPRIEALVAAGALEFHYLGTSVVRFRDLLRVKDVNGEPAGGRFAYYLARECAHDVFSVRRQHGVKEWLRFASATLGCASSLGGLGWLLSQLTSAVA